MSPEDCAGGAGRLVLVVGPSGAGKDTLLRLAAETLSDRPDIRFPRRLVTRPAGAHEDHDTVEEGVFAADAAQGRYPLCWRAHGLGYALPPQVLADLAEGATVVANVSRGVVEDARHRFPNVDVVLVSAPPEELARRIAARGRDPDVAGRIARAAPDVAVLAPELIIENVGAPGAGAAVLADFLARAQGAAAAMPPSKGRRTGG